MKTLRIIFAAALLGAATTAQAELKVVATLSTFGDLAETIGGDHVSVNVIAPPTFNPHFIEARPSDVLKLKKADAFVHGGAGLEAWKPPLVSAAGNPAVVNGASGDINLAQGIRLLEVPDRMQTRAEGDVHSMGNPHFWLDPRNGLVMARTIAVRFSELDPANASHYEANLAAFEAKLSGKIDAWSTQLAGIQSREVIAHHNQWPYLFAFTGLTAKVFVEPKPGIPPGPRHMKTLENYIEDNNIAAIVWSAVHPGKSANALSKRSGAPVVQLAQGVGEVKEASDYIALIDYNVRKLSAAFGS